MPLLASNHLSRADRPPPAHHSDRVFQCKSNLRRSLVSSAACFGTSTPRFASALVEWLACPFPKFICLFAVFQNISFSPGASLFICEQHYYTQRFYFKHWKLSYTKTLRPMRKIYCKFYFVYWKLTMLTLGKVNSIQVRAVKHVCAQQWLFRFIQA